MSTSSFHPQLSLENRGEVRTFSPDINQVLHAVMDSGCSECRGEKHVRRGAPAHGKSWHIFCEETALHHVLSSARALQRFLSHGQLPQGNPRRHFHIIYLNVGAPGASRPLSLHRTCFTVLQSEQRKCIGFDDKSWSNMIFHDRILKKMSVWKNFTFWNNKKMCWQISFLQNSLLICSNG